MKNVRCAGLVFAHSVSTDRPEIVEHRVPCGWTGERYTQGETVYTGDGTVENPLRVDLFASWQNDMQARTRKPCPHCGGRVTFIEPEVTR